MRPCPYPVAAAPVATLVLVLAMAGCGAGELGADGPRSTSLTDGNGNPVPGGGGAPGSDPGAPGAGDGSGMGSTNGPGFPSDPASANGQDPASPSPSDACKRSATGARAVPLSARQYRRALADLVGDGATDGDAAPPGLEADLDVLDRPWTTTAVLDRVMRDAEEAAEGLRGRTAAFLGCTDLQDTTCVRGGLSGLMERAFVRPPSADELDAIMALHAEARVSLPDDGGESAALLAIQAILAAPSTLYRSEFTTAANNGERSLSGHERAAAIATFLLDSVPDADLLAAASDGSLMTEAGLSVQVTRLVALPRVRRHLTGLVLNGYRATRVFESPKDEALFPEFTPTLQASMFGESQRFVDDVLWTRGAPVAELLLGTTTFMDPTLASLYDVDVPRGAADGDGFVAVPLPPGRAGLLTQPSILAGLSRTDKTSVVARGLFVRRDLLCLPKIPAPPDSVQAQVSEQLSGGASETELAEYRAETSPCNSCHAQFDRFGLSLEGFDAIGRMRQPGPGAIDLEGLAPLTGVINSPEDLVQVLAEDDRFTHCLAERLMDYALSTAGGGDAFCEADALHAAIDAGDGTLPAVIQAIVAHPAFGARKEAQP